MASKPSSPASFETAITELEGLVEQMERGDLPLEQSLRAYQRGAELVKYCRDTLAAVRQQVKVLEADVLKPFSVELDDDDTLDDGE